MITYVELVCDGSLYSCSPLVLTIRQRNSRPDRRSSVPGYPWGKDIPGRRPLRASQNPLCPRRWPLSLQKRRGHNSPRSGAGCPVFWRLPQMQHIVSDSVFSPLSIFDGRLDAGGWGSPQNALDIQTLCLQNQSPAGKIPRWNQSPSCSSDSWFCQTFQRRTDNISLFGCTDFSGHGVADLIAAYHQHSASAQFLTGNILKFPFFIGIFHLQVLAVRKFRADRDISQFINLAAVAF